MCYRDADSLCCWVPLLEFQTRLLSPSAIIHFIILRIFYLISLLSVPRWILSACRVPRGLHWIEWTLLCIYTFNTSYININVVAICTYTERACDMPYVDRVCSTRGLDIAGWIVCIHMIERNWYKFPFHLSNDIHKFSHGNGMNDWMDGLLCGSMVTKRKTFYQNDYHENNNNNKIEFALKRVFFLLSYRFEFCPVSCPLLSAAILNRINEENYNNNFKMSFIANKPNCTHNNSIKSIFQFFFSFSPIQKTGKCMCEVLWVNTAKNGELKKNRKFILWLGKCFFKIKLFW